PAAAAVAAPTFVSALGGTGPALAPPVPIARAAAATLPAGGVR
ncbi:TetR/AcrR family transcriptional regulator, partial [Roseomonas eburnea]|nr:TetR/AcrR family transcriptional regulator [Neoroseomonas eburnea]